MAEEIKIDTTGLTPEMAEQINKLCEQARQSAADLEATKAELDKKKEDIVALWQRKLKLIRQD